MTGELYAQYESQITFQNEDFVRVSAHPNMIFTLITGSISNLFQHKIIWHSVMHKSLLVMPRRWYKTVIENYGANRITYEHLPQHDLGKFVTVELQKKKEYEADMSLKVTRVNITVDQLLSAHVCCFNEILINQNLAK